MFCSIFGCSYLYASLYCAVGVDHSLMCFSFQSIIPIWTSVAIHRKTQEHLINKEGSTEYETDSNTENDKRELII